MNGLLASNGIWLEDEIQQSSNPAAHADGIITTMLREKIGWVCTNAAIPGSTLALQHLLDASQRHGYGAAGYWTQNYPIHMQSPQEFLRTGELDGAQIMIANLESRAEDIRWRTGDIDVLHALWPNMHAGVCWTEAAWGKNADGTYRSDLAARWRNGIASMPEAIQSENAGATIPAMADVNTKFGFKHEHTSYVLYFTRGYPADQYQSTINATGGRWSLFRYGDLDEPDWSAIRTWPRPTTEPVPEPPTEPEPQMPRGAAKSAYDAMDYWFASTAAGPAWRTGNPGEWAAVQAYRAAPPGAPAPVVQTKIGLMLVSILEAARWGSGEHE